MEGPQPPPVPRSRRLLLLQPPKSQFLVCHQPHLRLGQRPPTELAVRTTPTLFVVTGLRALVARLTVSVVIRLLIAATDARVGLALALPSLLPQALRQLQQTLTAAPSRLLVKLVFRRCTQVSCQTGKSCSLTKSRTTPKSSFLTDSTLTRRNTTLPQTPWLDFNTRFASMNVYSFLD